MPRRIAPLSDTQIKNAKANAKKNKKGNDADYKLADGDGLFLLVTTAGGKLWRFRYSFGSKEKLIVLGAYPAVSLADARAKRDAAKKLLANGIDPNAAKKSEKSTDKAEEVKAALTFKRVALEWYSKNTHTWGVRHKEDVLNKLEKDVFTVLGDTRMDTLKPSHVLTCVKKIEARGAIETAHRTRQIIEQVCGYALANEYTEMNAAALTKGALAKVPKSEPHPAITDPKELALLLRAIDGYAGSMMVRHAMLLGALTAVRPGELRHAEWSEIDFETATWSIPADKMKMKEPHIVPLSRQAVALLKDLQPLTGSSRYVFPNGRSYSKPLSENGVRQALISLDYQDRHCGHGWRATFRTILDEVLGERADFIEHQLAHAVKDATGRAYNRTSHLVARREMMQRWADYLDELKMGEKVVIKATE
jgi:integrase